MKLFVRLHYVLMSCNYVIYSVFMLNSVRPCAWRMDHVLIFSYSVALSDELVCVSLTCLSILLLIVINVRHILRSLLICFVFKNLIWDVDVSLSESSIRSPTVTTTCLTSSRRFRQPPLPPLFRWLYRYVVCHYMDMYLDYEIVFVVVLCPGHNCLILFCSCCYV